MIDALSALFERPQEERFEGALTSTTDAIDSLQQLLASFTPPRDERHRLQRLLSQLHFIRTALLDPQSPLEPLMADRDKRGGGGASGESSQRGKASERHTAARKGVPHAA
jgi:hypothetical protein